MKRGVFIVLLIVIAFSATAGVRVPDWVSHAAADTSLPKYSDKIAAVRLLDEQTVTATANGEIRSVTRVAYKILNTNGREYGYVAVPFSSETKLKRLTGWSIAASGQYQVGERDAVETAAFDGELYADQKVKVLRIPAAEPGSIVAYEYELISKPYGIQDMWRFQSNTPARLARYAVTLPDGWEYETHWVNATEVSPKRNGNLVVWEMKDVAAIEDEVRAPNVHASSGYMGISFIPPTGAGHRSWEAVSRWYNGLAEPRRAVSPAIEAKARALTANATTPWEKVAALARFAQRDVRYVAIEIGIGGYQPHAADSILSTLYGDCKDKVTVMSAMLRSIGIESHYVLVNSERGIVDERFPSMFGFNHAIIAVKVPEGAPQTLHAASNGLLFFDPTNPYVPLGLLPTYLQGSRGLVTGAAQLVAMPTHPPEASQLLRKAKLSLLDDGSLQGEVEEVRTGALAADFRASLAGLDAKARQQYIDSMLAYHLTQHTLKDLVIENADDPSKDLVIKYSVTATRYARSAGGMLLLRPRVVGRKAESVLDLSERTRDYITEGPSRQIDEIEIALPARLTADELPPPRKVETAAVKYTSESALDKNTLRYKRRYEVHEHVVKRDRLAELNKAFSEILADERTSAVFK